MLCFTSQILKQLTGKILPWEQAQNILDKKFTKTSNKKPVVLVVDEVSFSYKFPVKNNYFIISVRYFMYKKTRCHLQLT